MRAVTTDDIAWADLPDREEAGSPNVLGAVAIAAAVAHAHRDRAGSHRRPRERAHAVRDRSAAQRCPASPSTARPRAGPRRKVGVIPFTIDGVDHGLVAAVLGYEHGIGVRSGCFCAHPYIAHLLRLDRAEATAWVERARHGDKRGAPGMVRISFGCYNDRGDVDRRRATRSSGSSPATYAADYRADLDGSFHPAGYVEPLLFSLDRR